MNDKTSGSEAPEAAPGAIRPRCAVERMAGGALIVMAGDNVAEIVGAFRRDVPYLFLGSSFVAVGIVSAAFAVHRHRKRESLLIYFALFAALYGLRLWIWSPLVAMAAHGTTIYLRLRGAVSYVIVVPAFLFLLCLGLPRRFERAVAHSMVALGCILVAVTFIYGDSRIYDRINSIAIIASSGFFQLRFMASGSEESRGPKAGDFAVIRWGLLIFLAFVVSQNLVDLFAPSLPLLEPMGFAAFLGTLGYVAARSTLRRDQQLKEIRKELEVARRIQLSLLPGEFPASANFRVAAGYAPMSSVAGDLYDYVIADDHQVGLLIADVSGHGVPAALIASMVKLAAASQRSVAGDPSRFISGMNAALLGNTQNQFVTAAYAHLDADSEELRYSAAGHPPLLLVRNGEVTQIEENGLILAVFDSASYSTATYKLEEGDRIVMYTDGIVEASNAAGDVFSCDGLCDLLIKSSDLSPSMAAQSIITSVRHWSGKQNDDLTVLICDYIPTAGDHIRKVTDFSAPQYRSAFQES